MNHLNFSFLLLVLVSFFSTSALNAQDECNLLPPSEVTFIEVGSDYFHAVWPVTGTSVYQVSVIDLNDYSVLHQEEVYGEEIIVSGIPITETTYMVITCICDNGLPGSSGAVKVDDGTSNPIGTSDVVMQMGNDDTGGNGGSTSIGPRTLVCNDLVSSLTIDPATGHADVDLYSHQAAFLDLDYKDSSGNSLGNGQLVFNSNGRIDMATSATFVRVANNFNLNNPSQSNLFSYSFQIGNSPEFDLTFNIGKNALNNAGITANIRYCPIGQKITRKSTSSLQASTGSDQEEALDYSKEDVREEQPTQIVLLMAFPNPARNYVQVIKPANESLFVRNAYGQVVYHSNATDQQITIQMNNWPSGIYFIESQQNGQRQVARLIKK